MDNRNDTGMNHQSDKIKPWSCARAKFRVKTPEPIEGQRNNRMKTLHRLKQTAANGLNRSPYVEVIWSDGERTRALLDTGADWSLITMDSLSTREKENMKWCDRDGQGVTGETITVMGEVWRDVKVGDMDLPSQRFVVVKSMVTPVILGADFWSRLPPLTLNFNEGTLQCPGMGRPVRLYERQTEMKVDETQDIAVVVDGDIIVPARTEAIIRCLAEGVQVGSTYMVEPIRDDEGPVQAAYTIIKPTSKEVWVRVANVGGDEQKLEAGLEVASLTSDMWCSSGNAGRAFSVKSRFDGRLKGMCSDKLSSKKKSELTQVLSKYSSVFYDKGELPLVRIGVEHTLNLDRKETPIASRPRRLSPDLEKEVREELKELEEMGVIRSSSSPWAAPIVCARRANGKLRLAIDYRGLNSVTHPATLHPIPLVEDLFDRLSKARFFSVLDAKSGYHQMPLKETDAGATAFVVPWGQFEWSGRTPFGLKGAGYSFQRLMSAVLGSSNYNDALCYLDDILVWGSSWEEHMERLERVLAKIQKSGLALSIGKCKFGLVEVEYLGCVVRRGMLHISEQRVEQLRGIERPNNVRELRRALGAFAFVQRWLPGLAEIAKPLYNEITDKPYARLTWTGDMDEAFTKMKNLVANAVALKIPDVEKRFILVTDCSAEAAGAMLAQADPKDDNILVPVAFFHHCLTQAEKRYNTTEKELLAVVLAVKKYMETHLT